MDNKTIADKAQKIYHELYTVEDTLRGNSLEMHEECRKLACKALSYMDAIKQAWGGEIIATNNLEDREEALIFMQAQVEEMTFKELKEEMATWYGDDWELEDD